MSEKRKNESVTDMQRLKAMGIPITRKTPSDMNRNVIIRFPPESSAVLSRFPEVNNHFLEILNKVLEISDRHGQPCQRYAEKDDPFGNLCGHIDTPAMIKKERPFCSEDHDKERYPYTEKIGQHNGRKSEGGWKKIPHHLQFDVAFFSDCDSSAEKSRPNHKQNYRFRTPCKTFAEKIAKNDQIEGQQCRDENWPASQQSFKGIEYLQQHTIASHVILGRPNLPANENF